MKRFFVVTLVVFLALATVVPAFAAGGPGGTLALTATISSIDPSAGTVTLAVLNGNKLVQPFIGKSVTVTTIANTRYLYKSSPAAVPRAISFADLKAGDAVSVGGVLAGSIWTAARITVGASLTCIQ